MFYALDIASTILILSFLVHQNHVLNEPPVHRHSTSARSRRLRQRLRRLARGTAELRVSPPVLHSGDGPASFSPNSSFLPISLTYKCLHARRRPSAWPSAAAARRPLRSRRPAPPPRLHRSPLSGAAAARVVPPPPPAPADA
jgi:hypothetical protein